MALGISVVVGSKGQLNWCVSRKYGGLLNIVVLGIGVVVGKYEKGHVNV